MSGKPNDFVLGEGETRLTWRLPGATSELLQAYQKGYRRTRTRALQRSARRWLQGDDDLARRRDGGGLRRYGGEGRGVTIARGGEISCAQSWVGCPKPDMIAAPTSA